MVAQGLGGLPTEPALGLALQNLARESSPPAASDLPPIDAAGLTPSQRARAGQLQATLRASPDFLATLDHLLSSVAVLPGTAGAR
jgi:hypothetical protein